MALPMGDAERILIIPLCISSLYTGLRSSEIRSQSLSTEIMCV